ncbi:MarR family winged helix-turn-helix transcriptional regulator [Aquabacterium sp.]|uniref:MarR family winged helix-turn-helix transcriptional regulator n=1 Tax=Aquabacterium sp. TaxID=1872578 RepID=UPI003783968A
MTTSKKPNPDIDRTPLGRLVETGLHDIVGYQLAQAAIAGHHVFMHQVGDTFQLRPVEFTILALIEKNPGVSAKQLAQALAVTPPNITMWMDKLEGRGLVERERSTTDRRAQHIRTTPEGSALARKSVDLLISGETESFAVLSRAERALLLELLHKVARCRKAPASRGGAAQD